MNGYIVYVLGIATLGAIAYAVWWCLSPDDEEEEDEDG